MVRSNNNYIIANQYLKESQSINTFNTLRKYFRHNYKIIHISILHHFKLNLIHLFTQSLQYCSLTKSIRFSLLVIIICSLIRQAARLPLLLFSSV